MEYTLEVSGESFSIQLDRQKQMARMNGKKISYRKVGDFLFIDHHPIVYQIIRDKSGSVEGVFLHGKWIPVKIQGSDASRQAAVHHGEVRAPLNGMVARIFVQEMDFIKEGSVVLILEAMKMENEISAPVSGKVTQIDVKETEVVKAGNLLFKIEMME